MKECWGNLLSHKILISAKYQGPGLMNSVPVTFHIDMGQGIQEFTK